MSQSSKSFFDNILSKHVSELVSSKHHESAMKRQYIDSVDSRIDKENKIEFIKKQLRPFRKSLKKHANLSLSDNILYYTVENVVAEDVKSHGGDLDLGYLKFKIDLIGRSVKIVDGGSPMNYDPSSDEEYQDIRYHPHDLGDGSICFGTMDSDIIAATNRIQIDVILILLTKWANSYNSEDVAGANYARWTGEYVDNENRNYCERLDEYYDDDDCIWSNHEDDYIPNERSVYSRPVDGYLWDDRVIEVEGEQYPEDSDSIVEIDDDWYLKSDSNVICIDDEYYLIDSDEVQEINGDYYHESDCRYSNIMECHILASEAISHGDDYVTQEYYDEHLAN